MSIDYRALCEELLNALTTTNPSAFGKFVALEDRARAALAAESVREGVTDEEIIAFWSEHCAGDGDAGIIRLARYGHQPAPPAAGADCPACEGVPKPGNQPCAACGRSASSAGGEVAELAWWLRSLEDASVWFETGSPEALKLTRAAALLEQRHPTPVPVGMIPVEYWDIDSGARIVSELSEDGPSGCWIVLNSRHINPLDEFQTAQAAWDALQQATALPLPAGEVQP